MVCHLHLGLIVLNVITQVLIVGGGDGGVAREVAKHPSVETIVQVEIDSRVVEVSKKYLPFMGSGFSHPKLTLHIGDGFKFMAKHEKQFDVIITDSSDPVGECNSELSSELSSGYLAKLSQRISTSITFSTVSCGSELA